ncbi:MAG: ABC transporter ATP-binding protein [Spirochaetota bacterium]
MSAETVLSVRGLHTRFFTHEGVVRAVNGVDLDLARGGTLGLVGESGCGKSVTALSVMRLIPSPPGRIVDGEVLFEGTDLLALDERRMRGIRGARISMIFQEPMTSLDPVFTVGHEIMETLRLHRGLRGERAREAAVEALRTVGMPDPRTQLRTYPHELSGGMRQRVMIAMALACNPSLLIADEPTTALDVTIQAQILELIEELKERIGTSVILITHDLGVVAQMCDQVAVMYAGHVVERADVRSLFTDPLHPYTQGLRRSIPRLDVEVERLETISGTVPNLLAPPPGCPFHPRCPHCFDPCPDSLPPLREVRAGHFTRCFLYEQARRAVRGAEGRWPA